MSHASLNLYIFVVFVPSFTQTVVAENRVWVLNHDKELRRQVRRNMKGSESEEILKEKSFNKGRTENII